TADSTLSVTAALAASTALRPRSATAVSISSCVSTAGGRRMENSVLEKRWITAPSMLAASRSCASASCSIGSWYTTSTRLPPVKSRPKFRPRVASSTMERMTSRTDAAMVPRRIAMKLTLAFGLKNSILCIPVSRSDGNRGQFPATAVDPGGDGAAHGHRGEHRGQYAEEQHHREAAHRAGAEREQRDGRDQLGDVGVENDRP